MAQQRIGKDLKETIDSTKIQPFASILDPFIKQVLVETKQKRLRKGTFLIPKVLIWLVLAMTIRRDLNYHKVLGWLVGELRWKGLTLPARLLCEGAISHARVKLGLRIFMLIFQKVASLFTGVEPDFHGYVTIFFDGTRLNMPDTPKHTERFGKPSHQTGEGGYPQVRVVALMAWATRMIIDVAYAPIRGKGTGERTLIFQILQRIRLENALILFDAGFYSFSLLTILMSSPHHFLLKVSSTVIVKPIKRLPDGSYLALVRGTYVVRVICMQVAGFPPVRLITDILDPSVTAMELVRHYHTRWDIELGYDEIKTHQCATLRGQSPVILRSKRDDLVEQELYALFTTYNLTRYLMAQAAKEHGVEPLTLSFFNVLNRIIEATCYMNAGTKCQSLKQQAYLLKLIAESPINRPRRKRIAARVIKVKSSKFKAKRNHHKTQVIDYEKATKILALTNDGLVLSNAA